MHSSRFDGVNGLKASPATGTGLIMAVRSTFSSAGDRSVFATNGTLQGTSAHGGVNHVSWGCTYRNNNGHGIADTCTDGVANRTWIVLANIMPQSDTYGGVLGGSAGTGTRIVEIDTSRITTAGGNGVEITTGATFYQYQSTLSTVSGGSVSAYTPGSPP
jgi:hypothetical protein